MLKYLVLIGFVSLARSQTTSVSMCNNNANLPINVHVEGCGEPPCGFPQLQDALVHIIFQSPRVITDLQVRAVAYIGILPLVYPLGDLADACKGLTNSRCPLVAGEVVQYTLRMPIEPFMPVNTALNLEFSLMDATLNTPVVCLRVPIRIDSPVESLQSIAH